MQYFKFSGSQSNNCTTHVQNILNIIKTIFHHSQYFKFLGTPSNNGNPNALESDLTNCKIKWLFNEFSLIYQYLKFACSGVEKCKCFIAKKWITTFRTTLQKFLCLHLENS
jgi:hypothetical protein